MWRCTPWNPNCVKGITYFSTLLYDFFLMTLYSPNGTTFFSNYSDFILKMFFFNRGHVAIKRQSQGNKMNAEFNILFSPRHVRAFWNDLTFILQNIEHSTNCIVCVWLWSFWTSLYLKSHSHGWCYTLCAADRHRRSSVIKIFMPLHMISTQILYRYIDSCFYNGKEW